MNRKITAASNFTAKDPAASALAVLLAYITPSLSA